MFAFFLTVPIYSIKKYFHTKNAANSQKFVAKSRPACLLLFSSSGDALFAGFFFLTSSTPQPLTFPKPFVFFGMCVIKDLSQSYIDALFALAFLLCLFESRPFSRRFLFEYNTWANRNNLYCEWSLALMLRQIIIYLICLCKAFWPAHHLSTLMFLHT